MILNREIIEYIDRSVLCWLATSSQDGAPNVSPKEVFTHFKDQYLIIANIASPKSAKNIDENAQVAVSFIDVFIQKGFQLKGSARLVRKGDSDFSALEKPLLEITQGRYPFSSIFKIAPQEVKSILAPSYRLFPEIHEAEKSKQAIEHYLRENGTNG